MLLDDNEREKFEVVIQGILLHDKRNSKVVVLILCLCIYIYFFPFYLFHFLNNWKRHF